MKKAKAKAKKPKKPQDLTQYSQRGLRRRVAECEARLDRLETAILGDQWPRGETPLARKILASMLEQAQAGDVSQRLEAVTLVVRELLEDAGPTPHAEAVEQELRKGQSTRGPDVGTKH